MRQACAARRTPSSTSFSWPRWISACRCSGPGSRAPILDVNREPYELDPRMFEGRLPAFANTRSVRVAGGLGTIARVVGDAQEIYARRLPVEDALRRIERPAQALPRGPAEPADRARGRSVRPHLADRLSFDAVVFARHGRGARGRAKADLVIGDRYGTSCDRTFVDAAEYELRRFGYTVDRNKPYAGGFITEYLRQPGRQPPRAADRDQSRALHGRAYDWSANAAFAEVSRHVTEVVRALVAVAARRTFGERAAAE